MQNTEEGARRWPRVRSKVGEAGSAPVLLYLHKGSQDFPGFLVEFFPIPVRVESLEFFGQPVVLAEKEGVGSSQQDVLRGSGIS